MAEGYFGFGELDEFEPDYGGVNWRPIYEHRMDRLGHYLPQPAWFETFDDLGPLQEQLTQENFIIYLNKADPGMDVVSVHDPRDGAWIMCTRDQIGDEEFNKIKDSHHTEALIVQTKYPLKMIAEYIMGKVGVDIQNLESEGFPEDFGGLPPAVGNPE